MSGRVLMTPAVELPGQGGEGLAVGPARGDDRRTLRIDLSYDGARFHGWQRQVRERTVQGELERALARVLGAPHAIVGAGRTDAGTHAHQQVASFRTTHRMPCEILARALDACVPEDVGIRSVRAVEPAFHAQRDAAWKWYRYRLLPSARHRPLLDHRTWRRRAVPPLEALRAAAQPLEGQHDFASFANAGSTPGPTVRRLIALRWREISADGDDDLGSAGARLLCLDAIGDGFLYKMVRTLVGTLLEAATRTEHGSEAPGTRVRRVLAARDRRVAGAAAPARGLTLMALGYPGEAQPPELPSDLATALDAALRSGHVPRRRACGVGHQQKAP